MACLDSDEILFAANTIRLASDIIHARRAREETTEVSQAFRPGLVRPQCTLVLPPRLALRRSPEGPDGVCSDAESVDRLTDPGIGVVPEEPHEPVPQRFPRLRAAPPRPGRLDGAIRLDGEAVLRGNPRVVPGGMFHPNRLMRRHDLVDERLPALSTNQIALQVGEAVEIDEFPTDPLDAPASVDVYRRHAAHLPRVKDPPDASELQAEFGNLIGPEVPGRGPAR